MHCSDVLTVTHNMNTDKLLYASTHASKNDWKTSGEFIL